MDSLSPSQIKLLVRAADGIATESRSAKTAKGLIDIGLLAIEPNEGGGERWRTTDAGRAAAGLAGAPDHPTSEVPAPDPIADKVDAGPPKPKGKIAALIALLDQPKGATLAALMAATNWQAHSVRGAISGAIKSKLGLTVTSEKTDGVRVYRIVRAAADLSEAR